MRTVTVPVYTFDELPPNVQSRVVERWRDDDTFPWSDEWWASLEAFCGAVGEKVPDCRDEGWGICVYYRPDTDETDPLPEIDLSGSCPFTGYCGDESLLDGIRNAKPGDSRCDILRACFNGWAKEFNADLEYWFSERAIRKDITEGEYEFTADGRIWPA